MFALDSLLTRVSKNPHLWNVLRRVVEANFRGEKAIIARELSTYINQPSCAVLDLGCGTGEFAPCFPPPHYIGVDISIGYVAYANRTYAGRFAVSNGELLAFRDETFDAALVLGVLHHLPDNETRQVIAELHRVLRPEAVALVMEDIPPPDPWNIAGHAMHWLDRGGYIRTEQDYRAFFTPHFSVEMTGTMRSGICDYGVYRLRRQ